MLKERGATGARRIWQLRQDVEAPIAAILTVNTIAHTVGAAWCGAMVSDEFGSRALGVFAAVFTVLVLALTEIVPKSLGVRFAGPLGPFIVWPLQLMIWSVAPVVWVARWSMRLLTGRAHSGVPSEEEVVLFSRLAARGGAVRGEEHRWVRNALLLDQSTAADLLTPRTVIETLPADTSVAELRDQAPAWRHSRVPVTEGGDLDRVIGIVLRREVFDAALTGREGLRLRELMHPIRFVPATMPAHRLLTLFLQNRTHLVGVLDEYGGLDGIVTLEDVLECLLGEEIVDEHDEVADLQELARERSPLAEPDAGS
jgi:CBS domain containing-hemolysin-like protein